MLVSGREAIPLKDGIVLRNEVTKPTWDGFKSEDMEELLPELRDVALESRHEGQMRK